MLRIVLEQGSIIELTADSWIFIGSIGTILLVIALPRQRYTPSRLAAEFRCRTRSGFCKQGKSNKLTSEVILSRCFQEGAEIKGYVIYVAK